MKKKGSVKPKKKESAAATKKAGRGMKGGTPADSHTPPPEEVVAEGGMPTADERVPTAQGGLPTGEGRMEAPAASSAGQVAPAKGQHPVEGPSTDRVVPTSAESQQGKAHFAQGDSQHAGLAQDLLCCMCMLLVELLCFHGEVFLHMKHRDHLYGSTIVGVHILKTDPAVNHISVCSNRLFMLKLVSIHVTSPKSNMTGRS